MQDFLSKKDMLNYKFLFVIQHIIGYNNIRNSVFNFYKKLLKSKKTETIIPTKNYSKSLNNDFFKQVTLLKNEAQNWPCVQKWNLEFLKENFGNQEISIINSKGLVEEGIQNETENTTLSQYIDELKNGTLKYLKLSDLVNKNKALQDDINFDWLKKVDLKGSTGKTFYSFIGGKGTKTPTHNEFPVNIYIQVWGKKRWVLYPPENHVYLNAITERRTYFFSKANPDNPDNPETPLLKYADKIEIILEPGDILIVPPFTWHYVENLTDSIAVAYKYANMYASWKSSKLFTILSLLSTKPSIFSAFIINRIKKKDSVLE